MWHSLRPVTLANVPGTHCVQLPEPAPDALPRPHGRHTVDRDSASDRVPAAHVSHVLLPPSGA